MKQFIIACFTLLVIFGCASPEDKRRAQLERQKIEADRIQANVRYCENAKKLEKGMTMEQVGQLLGKSIMPLCPLKIIGRGRSTYLRFDENCKLDSWELGC